MSIQLGMHLTPSFAEFCLADTHRPDQPLLFQRTYLQTRNLAASLKQVLEACPQPPEKVVVASSFLEKILESRLGGTVAQLVTQGFEEWAWLRQSLQHSYLELNPKRTQPLASPELIFGVPERITAEGLVLRELSPSDIDPIIQKLRAAEVERVCVNLLFADQNSIHQDLLVEALTLAGFEVFSRPAGSLISDEVQIWRHNTLNAALSGTFSEVRSLLAAALPAGLPLEFLNSNLEPFTEDPQSLLSSLFAPAEILARLYANHHVVLNLGLESWFGLKPGERTNVWRSVWGEIGLSHTQVTALSVQPTSELTLDSFLDLNFTGPGLGYEPGPMTLGRAVKPLIVDLLYHLHPWDEVGEWKGDHAGKHVDRFAHTMQAVLKGQREYSGRNQSLQFQLQELLDRVLDLIAMQTYLLQSHAQADVVITGFFAPLLYPLLKKRWPFMKWVLCPLAQKRTAMGIFEVQKKRSI